MATWQLMDAAASDIANVYWLGAAAPTSTNFRLILCNAGALTKASNITAVAAAEIANANGYTDGALLTGGAIAFDAAQLRAEVTYPAVTITASGGDITYDQAVIIADAPTSDYSASRPVLLCDFGSAQTIPNGQDYAFTVQYNHGENAADVSAA